MGSESTRAARLRAHRPELPDGPRERPGAAEVTREALRELPAPARSHTWQPLPHLAVITMAEDALGVAGRRVRQARYLLARNGRRLAVLLDLLGEITSDVFTRLVVRSNLDSSGSLALGVGAVHEPTGAAWCYRTERYGLRYTPGVYCRAPARLAATLKQLPVLEDQEAGALRRFKELELTPTHCESILLRAWEGGAISPREMRRVLTAWRGRHELRLERHFGFELLTTACKGVGDRWRKDVDGYRQAHRLRCHFGRELAGL